MSAVVDLSHYRLRMFMKLLDSSLTKSDAKKLAVKLQDPNQTSKSHGIRVWSFRLPYFDPNGKPTNFYRTRLLQEFSSFRKKHPKYLQPSATEPRFYLPPLLPGKATWNDLRKDVKVPILITEGELKAACATKAGIPTIGLGGVWNWQAKKKLVDMIPDFDLFDWTHRNVWIAFDSDTKTNNDVHRALVELSKALLDLGAIPLVVTIPALTEENKTGIDDFIVAKGADAFKMLLDEAEPFTMAKALHELNSEVAYIENYGIIVRLKDGLKMKPSDFVSHAYAPRKFLMETDKGVKSVPAAPEWLKWPNRRVLKSLVYEPGEPLITSNGCYNLWKGWGCEPKKGDVRPWHQLMDQIFGPDDKARQWFERWCAIQFQEPGIKLYSSVLFWSVAEGTGKSLTAETLGRIFGKNYALIHRQDLEGNFNGWAENRQFILADDLTGSDNRKFAEVLRAMVTREELQINIKYLPTYFLRDCINYFFTSNSPVALFLEESDRRNFVHELQNGPLEAEFARYYDKWMRGEGPSYLFQYFLDLDLGDFDAKSRAYITDAKNEMIHYGRSDATRWAFELKQNPDTILKIDNATSRADLYKPTQLYSLYDPEGRRGVHINGFGVALKKAGVLQRMVNTIRGDAKTMRLYAVRNTAKWEKASPREWAEHWEEHFGPRKEKF